jgi:hypothetical protein
MAKFFTRERFGSPQFIALMMLIVFLAECLWLVDRNPVRPDESARIRQGLLQWRQGQIAAGDPEHSPLYYLIASAGVVIYPASADPIALERWRWLARAPWIALGLLLGASLWYVARRLYGNLGGYIALALYCFAPTIVAQSAGYFAPPEVAAVWGTFGAVFTSIAVAHTLYAPRRVMWNWWRISLLALSLALAIGSQFALWILLPLGLAFLFYLAPGRRAAALAIYGASCGIAALILLAAYYFEFGALRDGVARANLFHFAPSALAMPESYLTFFWRLMRTSPALLILLPTAWIAFAAWPRARYFGNTAPLLVSGLLVLLGLMSAHEAGLAFELAAIPILFIFIAGVFADLLETKHRAIVLAVTTGVLIAHAFWSIGSRGGLLAAGSRAGAAGAFRP